MEISERRYDIDWLRVIAIGLLLIYHIAIGFQPWGVFIGFIQNSESMESIWVPMSMLNVWRIPLLFFVSGMGVCFAIRRRNWKQLIGERSKRILLPYVFGLLAIVPIHVYYWQNYYSQEIQYLPNPGHLWFLGNIFVYVLVLIPIFFYLKKKAGSRLHLSIQRIMGHPLGLLVIAIPFVIESVLVKPEAYEMYAFTWHGFALGMIAFFFGFCCVYAGDSFWKNVLKSRWVLLVLAMSLYLVRLIVFELKSPGFAMAIESCLWVFTVFGFGYKHLNRPSKALSYLSQAAYPIYIIHMIFLYWSSYLFFPTDLRVEVKFLFVNLITYAGCFISYEFLIRRINIIRPLFGLKLRKKEERPKGLSELKTA